MSSLHFIPPTFILFKKKNTTGRLYSPDKNGDKNVYLSIWWICPSRAGMTSALKTALRQVNEPRLCKKPALLVQLNRIQPRLVELAERWRGACSTTAGTTTANWPQDKDVHIHTRPAAHLEDTSPTGNLGRARLRRFTPPKVIAL